MNIELLIIESVCGSYVGSDEGRGYCSILFNSARVDGVFAPSLRMLDRVTRPSMDTSGIFSTRMSAKSPNSFKLLPKLYLRLAGFG